MPREIPAPLPRTSVCSDPASAFPRPFRSAARRGETTHSCPAVFHGHRSCVRAAARSEPSAPSPHKSRAPFPTGSRYGPVADGCVLPLLLELPPPSAVPSIAGQPGGSVPQPPCVASRPSRPMAAPSGRPGFLQRPSSRAASRLAATQFDMVSSWRLSLFLGKENLLQPIKAGAESRYYLRSTGHSLRTRDDAEGRSGLHHSEDESAYRRRATEGSTEASRTATGAVRSDKGNHVHSGDGQRCDLGAVRGLMAQLESAPQPKACDRTDPTGSTTRPKHGS